MTKVKIVESTSFDKLELQINKFLTESGDYNIKDIKYTVNIDGLNRYYSALIIYVPEITKEQNSFMNASVE
jgi:hypothetical protein